MRCRPIVAIVVRCRPIAPVIAIGNAITSSLLAKLRSAVLMGDVRRRAIRPVIIKRDAKSSSLPPSHGSTTRSALSIAVTRIEIIIAVGNPLISRVVIGIRIRIQSGTELRQISILFFSFLCSAVPV